MKYVRQVINYVPMHIEITPKRQSLPRRFISLRRVLTHRAPYKRDRNIIVVINKNILNQSPNRSSQFYMVVRRQTNLVGYNNCEIAEKIPVAPNGCPRAIAPPLTLTFVGSSSNFLQQYTYWDAKAYGEEEITRQLSWNSIVIERKNSRTDGYIPH